MPIYEFRCPNGRTTERLAKVDTKEIRCPKCQQRAEKIVSLCSFELKGRGWFADGYASKRTNK